LSYYVYILTNRPNGTLYIGVTNNLERRISEHRLKTVAGFTKRYDIDRLVYYETFDRIDDAIAREKQLKHWNRAWKVRLILQNNPEWHDLFEEFYNVDPRLRGDDTQGTRDKIK